MKNKKLIFIIISFIMACNNKTNNLSISYYSGGEIKERKTINDKGNPEGLFELFYKNGNLKEIGYMKDGLKLGWWKYYHKNGKLISEKEYLISKDTVSLLNQNINYKIDGEIDFEKSVYFKIDLPDTLIKGVNFGNIEYYAKSDAFKKYLYVILENKRTNKVVKDTFTNQYNYTEFATVMQDTGHQVVKGKILEQLLFFQEMENDSATLKIENKMREFSKKVYVKEVSDN